MTLHILHAQGWAENYRSVVGELSDNKVQFVTAVPRGANVVMRWGFIGPSGFRGTTLNKADNIRISSNKGGFARILARENIGPRSWDDVMMWAADEWGKDGEYIVRPERHARGENLLVINRENMQEMFQTVRGWAGPYYIRPRINKRHEYRAYVLMGRVTQIEEKTVENPQLPAWGNDGSAFTNIKWGEWNLDVAKKAIRAVELAGLHYGAVDVITDDRGAAHVLEVNTAPDLYLRRPGQASYLQRTQTKAFVYHVDKNNYDFIPVNGNGDNWKKLIHPAMSDLAMV